MLKKWELNLCAMEFWVWSYILLFTSFACNAVDQVRALAGNVMPARVLDGRCSTFEGASK